MELMTDKAEESAVGARSQMKRPGKSVVPPPFKRILRMTLLSEKKGSEGASHPRGSAMSLEDEYEKILKLLEGAQVPPELWRKYVAYAMKEAARFQRQDVISHLEKVLDTLESDHFLNKDIHTPNLNSPQGSDQ